MDSQRQRRISKTLSKILRHKAIELKLPISPEGYIPIDILLKHQWLKQLNTTRDDLEQVVKGNDKQRFTIQDDQIRANQGHSIPLTNLELTKITLDNYQDYPTVLHGTYYRFWHAIKEQGLLRGTRNHVHLAQGRFGQVKSGVRNNVDILIYLDLEKAIHPDSGLTFYESANGVVLCEGPISAEYFSHVVDAKTGKAFDPDFPDHRPHF